MTLNTDLLHEALVNAWYGGLENCLNFVQNFVYITWVHEKGFKVTYDL